LSSNSTEPQNHCEFSSNCIFYIVILKAKQTRLLEPAKVYPRKERTKISKIAMFGFEML
jgi:hypothetical protein